MQLSDAWFFLRHPMEFYREIYLPSRAEKVGKVYWEM